MNEYRKHAIEATTVLGNTFSILFIIGMTILLSYLVSNMAHKPQKAIQAKKTDSHPGMSNNI